MAIHYFFESSGGDIYGVYGDQEIDLHLERERDFGTPLTITDEFRQLAETLIHSYRGYSYVAEFFEVARVSTRLFESMNVRERFKRSEVIFTSLPLDIEAIVDLSDETLSKILVEFPTSYLKDLIAADEGRKVADRLAKFLTDSEKVKTLL